MLNSFLTYCTRPVSTPCLRLVVQLHRKGKQALILASPARYTVISYQLAARLAVRWSEAVKFSY